MIGGVGVLLLVATVAGGLHIETGTPDALCPELSQVRAALATRLGDIEGEGEWQARYALVHRPDAGGDVVRLELRDPEGRLRLARALPRTGSSCTAVGQAMVLQLDAFFRHPTEPGESVTLREDAGAASVVVAQAPPPPAAPPSTSVSLGLLGGWTAGPSSPALTVSAALAFGAGWHAGLDATWLVDRREALAAPASDARVATRSGALRIHAGHRLRLGARAALRLGPEVVIGVDRVVTEGIPGGRSNVRGWGGFGARGELDVAISRAVSLLLVAAADLTPPSWAGEIRFDNGADALFPPARFRLFAGLGVGVRFSP
jgi:hypothetical protein